MGIGNPPPTWVPDAFEQRVLAAVASPWGDQRDTMWRGDRTLSMGATQGALAAKMHVKPWTAERQALAPALTNLRRRGLVRYELDRVTDTEITWWLTDKEPSSSCVEITLPN